MTDAEILDEVLVRPRGAFVPLPELEHIERPGWSQLITPTFRRGGFNDVALAVLDEAEADAVIDATIAQYRARDLWFRWAVPPGSAPADLAQRLAARGGEARWTCAMARRIEAAPPPPADPALVVEPITDEAGLERFTRTMAEGWQVDPGPLHRANAIALADPARNRFFLARRGGAPAGVASYVAFPRSAYLLGAVVLPAHRGRGLYRALVDARLADAHALGLTLATSHARETSSAPILARLGFAQVVRFPTYEFRFTSA